MQPAQETTGGASEAGWFGGRLARWEAGSEGVRLGRHYMHAFCSPSRSAIQSGRAPLHVNAVNSHWYVSNSGDPVGGFAGVPCPDAVDTSTPLEADIPLMEAGFTSVMAARLASDLQTRLQAAVSPVVLFQYPTSRLLEAHLREVAADMPDEFKGVERFTEFLESFRASARQRFETAVEDEPEDTLPLFFGRCNSRAPHGRRAI